MRHKIFVEEYIPRVKNLENVPTTEPTELNEYSQPMPTTFSDSPSSRPTRSIDSSYRPYNTITPSPSNPSEIYSYAPFSYEYKSIPPSYNPIDIPLNSTAYFYSNNKYNIIVFGIATGLGSFCFFVICAYVYKIYASKRYKLQKIQKHALKREDVSLNDIQIGDYNSTF